MNATLKELAAQRGTDPVKVEYLAHLLGDDGAELVLRQAAATEKAADGMGIAYKADVTGDTSAADAGGDGLTLSQEDLDAIRAVVEQAMQGQAGAPVASAKLTDSGPQSKPVGQKAARVDPYVAAVQGNLNSNMVPR